MRRCDLLSHRVTVDAGRGVAVVVLVAVVGGGAVEGKDPMVSHMGVSWSIGSSSALENN